MLLSLPLGDAASYAAAPPPLLRAPPGVGVGWGGGGWRPLGRSRCLWSGLDPLSQYFYLEMNSFPPPNSRGEGRFPLAMEVHLPLYGFQVVEQFSLPPIPPTGYTDQ